MTPANPARKYKVASVSCGRDHTLALLDDGKVIGWGGDGSGRIPSGMPEYCTTPAPTRPVEVLLRDPVTAVAAGYGLSLGIVGAGMGMFIGLLFVRYINEIADLLGVTEGTVKIHVSAVMRALNVSNRAEAALIAAGRKR